MRLRRIAIAVWLRAHRRAAVATLALATSLFAFADREPPLTAHPSWYGLYTTARDERVEDESSWTGDRIVSTGITPPQVDSDNIAIVAGERFGLGFALSGPPPERIVRLRWVRLFPPPDVPIAGEGGRRMREEQELAFAVGRKDLFLGYRIDRPQDDMPGTWTFQLWDGDSVGSTRYVRFR